MPLTNVKEYYEQRACTPGTLLISEGVVICPEASGCPYTPGIWSEEQIRAWKEVSLVDSVWCVCKARAN